MLLSVCSTTDLPAFHLPPRCSSIFGGLAAGGEGGGGGPFKFDKCASDSIQDDDRGEPPDLGRTLCFFVAFLTPPSVCPPLLCLGGPVK